MRAMSHRSYIFFIGNSLIKIQRRIFLDVFDLSITHSEFCSNIRISCMRWGNPYKGKNPQQSCYKCCMLFHILYSCYWCYTAALL